MDIVIRIVVWAIILLAVMTWLGSKSSGDSDSEFDTKDPGNFY